MKATTWYCLILGLVIGFCLVSGWHEADKDLAILAVERGRLDRKAGVPAEANPYTTRRTRLGWLDGWKEQ